MLFSVVSTLIALFAPVVLLLLGGFAAQSPEEQFVYFMGAGALTVLAGAIVAYHRSLQPPLAQIVFITSLAGLLWLIAILPEGSTGFSLAYRQILEGGFALLMAGVLSYHWLVRSGAWLFRRARLLSRKVATKTDWPSDLFACKELPIVRQFREALLFRSEEHTSELQS